MTTETAESKVHSHHMKMATLNDWLLNLDQEYINLVTEMGSSPNIDFEFRNEEKQFTASTADELFHEGKLLPLETVQKRRHNNNNNTTTPPNVNPNANAIAAEVWLHSSIEGNDINNVVSASRSRRFSTSNVDPPQHRQFQIPSDPVTERTKPVKQSWLKRHFSSKGSYPWASAAAATTSSYASSSNSSSFSFGSFVCNGLKAATFRRSISSVRDLEKSIDEAITHFKLSQSK